MTQTNNKRQAFNPYSIEEYNELRNMVAKLEARCCQEAAARRQAEAERDEALQEKVEALQENYIVQRIVGDPNLTDKDKLGGIAYYEWYISTKPSKENGARYFSLQEIAARLGWPRTEPDKPSKKEQAFSPVHTKLKNAGLIQSTPEHQKNNPSRQNNFDLMNPQFILSAGNWAFEQSDKASNRGGRRIALHRECGGQCVERVTYSCMKCGHGHLDKNHIILVDEEKWDKWQAESMPCAHCGEEVAPGAQFCVACGSELDKEPEQAHQPPTQQAPEEQAEAEREAEIKAEQDAWHQLQMLIEVSAPTEQARISSMAALQAFTEEIRGIDSPPAAEPPDRDCFECTYRYGAPVRDWVWDLRKSNWACAKSDEHHLPKVEF